MTKSILFLTTTLLLFVACNKTNVKISGDVKEGGKQKVYLQQLNVNDIVVIDSTVTNKSGKFSFHVNVESPTFFNVKIGEKENITLIGEPDANIELSGTFKGLSHNYWVDGSENSLWIKLLQFQLHNTQTMLDSLQKTYHALPKDASAPMQQRTILAAWDSTINKQINFSKEFILKHAISPASYYALYQKFNETDYILVPDENLHSFKVVASSMQAMHPNSQYTQAILTHLAQINKDRKNNKLLDLIASSEGTLPNISLPNINGDTISLNSLKGKFIVLDFCVLTAKDSKAYINEFRQVYNKFKKRGVEIYQVCLDPDKNQWERIVKKENIDWICLWDADGLKSRAAGSWNIKNIPADYMINQKYEIVGKDLYGRRLEDRINDLLK